MLARLMVSRLVVLESTADRLRFRMRNLPFVLGFGTAAAALVPALIGATLIEGALGSFGLDVATAAPEAGGVLRAALWLAACVPIYQALDANTGPETIVEREPARVCGPSDIVPGAEIAGIDVKERHAEGSTFYGIYVMRRDGSRMGVTPGEACERFEALDVADRMRRVLDLPHEGPAVSESSLVDELKRTFGR